MTNGVDRRRIQKEREIAAARRVAQARGCTVEPNDGEWPDVFFVTGDVRTPGEVVSAWERQPDQEEHGGARNARAWAHAQREADRIARETGAPAVAHANGPHWFAGQLGEQLPVPLVPVYPVHSVCAAITQKIQKRYPDGAVLVVEHHGFPLEVWELHEAADALGAHRFSEIWIVPDFGDRVQRLPSAGTPIPVDEAARYSYRLEHALDVVAIGLRDNCEAHDGFEAIERAKQNGALEGLALDGTALDVQRVAQAAGVDMKVTIRTETNFLLTTPACGAEHRHHNRFSAAEDVAE